MQDLTVTLSQSPQNPAITLLTVKGSMDTNTISEFQKSFESAMRENQFKLVIDLKDVHYISSAGWGLFVSEIKRIRQENGDLVLSGMSPEVMEVFELLEFDTILKYFPEVDSAVKKGFQGLPPWVDKAAPPKNRVKKIISKAPPLEATPVSVPLAAPPTEAIPAAATSLPEIPVIGASSRKSLLRNWRFWAVGLLALAALGAYGITGHLAWWPHGAVLHHLRVGKK